MHDEQVTHSAGVPTVWLAMLAHIDANGLDFGSLKHVAIGGSAAPRAMLERFMKAGVHALPCLGHDRDQPDRHDGAAAVELGCAQLRRTGRRHVLPGLPALWRGNANRRRRRSRAAARRRSSGRLQVRGPWVIRRYLRADADAVDQDGWFDMGDVSVIHADGTMQITDRAKSSAGI